MARLVPRAYAHLGSTIGLSGQDHLPAGTRYGSLACGPLRRQAPRCTAHWEPSGMRALTTEAVSALKRRCPPKRSSNGVLTGHAKASCGVGCVSAMRKVGPKED